MYRMNSEIEIKVEIRAQFGICAYRAEINVSDQVFFLFLS